MRVCVIFGGVSSEYMVSLMTSKNIIMNLDHHKYDVSMIGITQEGEWFLYEGDPEALPNDGWLSGKRTKAILSPDRKDRAILTEDGRKIPIDVCVLGVHGQNAEDGTLQGLLELAGIPYTGPGVLGSALCMDKAAAKVMLREAGIPVADWVCIESLEGAAEAVRQKFTYPVFVKPSGAGSSLGAAKVNCEEELLPALQEAMKHDSRVLVEEYVECREVECAIIGNEEPRAAMPGEVLADTEFYTYEAKYVEGMAGTAIPPRLPEETIREIQEIGLRAYRALHCSNCCRIDFFVTKENRVILNELNTLPGCTNSSMFPVLWREEGVAFPDLLDQLIQYAIDRNKGENRIG